MYIRKKKAIKAKQDKLQKKKRVERWMKTREAQCMKNYGEDLTHLQTFSSSERRTIFTAEVMKSSTSDSLPLALTWRSLFRDTEKDAIL